MKLAQNLDLKGKNHKVEDLETYRGPVDAQGDWGALARWFLAQQDIPYSFKCQKPLNGAQKMKREAKVRCNISWKDWGWGWEKS